MRKQLSGTNKKKLGGGYPIGGTTWGVLRWGWRVPRGGVISVQTTIRHKQNKKIGGWYPMGGGTPWEDNLCANNHQAQKKTFFGGYPVGGYPVWG